MAKKEKTDKSEKLPNRSALIPFFIDENGALELMFMMPSNKKFGGDKYQLCKGRIDPGETPQEAALREGQEELGLFTPNIEDVHNLGIFLGRTYVFTGRIKDKNMFGDPHFETEKTIWMTPEQFYNDGRDIHIPVVKAAVRFINKTRA
jgi:8-oxo-dGTP pyrophosphatase MutT (NUDIX family)